MQQDLTSEDDERQEEPEWVLASYGRRVGAWALDFVGFLLPGTLALIQLLSGVPVLSYFESWGSLLAMWIAWVGYTAWGVFVLRRGQTPGKQIVGVRAIKGDGSPSGWGYTFLREFVIKFLLSYSGYWALGYLGLGIFALMPFVLVDYLWPLWDRAGKMQTLHDKLLGTIVVRNRE